ncbi:MAG: hypothetical protein M0D57_08660 [Sphingobacteriales bacterium JAD_PAG50586_3]|nr:MAG: hypothetical protein M0D57_08660 [Sphingobacteriales bacterium JAD_PAG50586_3]
MVDGVTDTVFVACESPDTVRFTTPPTGFVGTYRYQWFSCNGDCQCPSDITDGNYTMWGAVGSQQNYVVPSDQYDATYACIVTPDSSSNGSQFTNLGAYAQSCKKVKIVSSGYIGVGGIQGTSPSTCSIPADPQPMSFMGIPDANFGTSYTLQWYYKDGFNACPQDGESGLGWNVIPGATEFVYDPPADLTNSRTYVCKIDRHPDNLACNDPWTNCIYMGVATQIDYGTITAGDQTFCTPFTQSQLINFSTMPTSNGNLSFNYKWYYKDSVVGCPTGGSTTGWIPATETGFSSPQLSIPLLNNNKTYACLVSPNPANNSCGPQWATSCRKYTANYPVFNSGAITTGNQEICPNGDPTPITFSTLPSGGSGTYTYTWIYRPIMNGGTCSETDFSSWAVVANSNSPTLDPPVLTAGRVYKCMVYDAAYPGCSGKVASGCFTINVSSELFYGWVDNTQVNFCPGYDPDPIGFSIPTVGTGQAFTYQWYYTGGTGACPSGPSINNVTIIPGATGATYDSPPLTIDRKFACYITPVGTNPCGVTNAGRWATNCKPFVAGSTPNWGSVSNNNHNLCAGGIPLPMSLSTPSGVP